MRKYSIKTLLLLTVIAALVVSQFVLVGQLQQARSELDMVPGRVIIDDPSLTYVRAITSEHNQLPQSVRIVTPADSRYLLRLCDATFDDETPVQSLPVTETIALNGWRDGADVVLTCKVQRDNGSPVIKVHTDKAEFFNYTPKRWIDSGQGTEGSFASEQQRTFKPDESIPITRWRDTGTGRGIAVWLEPYEKAKLRQDDQREAG